MLLRRRLPYTAAVPLAAGLVTAPGATATPPTTFDPIAEAQNFSITQQRQAIYDTPQYQTQLAADGAASTAQALAAGDGWPGDYSYVKIDTTPDAVRGTAAALSRR